MPKRTITEPGSGGNKKLKLSAPGSLDHMVLPPELEGKLDFKPDVKTADGRPWKVKIVSWNVNGIRAVAKSAKFHYVKFEDPDILCLQETKCAEEDFPDECKLLGYHKFYNSAAKKGYSSTALFSKTKPLSVTYDIGIAEHDSEGRVITAEFAHYYVVNVYVPNSGRGLVRLPYRRKWNADFLDYCSTLDKNKPVIIAGDLNVAHAEIDLANPKSNVKNSGFTPEEREDFGTWLEAGFTDSFRYFNPDKTGAYTFWTYMGNARGRNVGWRIDYFVVSSRLMTEVVSSEIRELVKGSDHCPIMLLVAEPREEEAVGEEAGAQVAERAGEEAGVEEGTGEEANENDEKSGDVTQTCEEKEGENTKSATKEEETAQDMENSDNVGVSEDPVKQKTEGEEAKENSNPQIAEV